MYYSVKRRRRGSVYVCICHLEQLYPEEPDLTWTMESIAFPPQHLGQSQGSAHAGRVQDSIHTTFQLLDHIPYFLKLIYFSYLPFRVCVFQEKCLCVLESIMCFLVKGSPSWTDECKSLLGSCRQPQEELLRKQRVRNKTITRKLWLTQRLSDQVTQHGIQRLAPE